MKLKLCFLLVLVSACHTAPTFDVSIKNCTGKRVTFEIFSDSYATGAVGVLAPGQEKNDRGVKTSPPTTLSVMVNDVNEVQVPSFEYPADFGRGEDTLRIVVCDENRVIAFVNRSDEAAGVRPCGVCNIDP